MLGFYEFVGCMEFTVHVYICTLASDGEPDRCNVRTSMVYYKRNKSTRENGITQWTENLHLFSQSCRPSTTGR